MKNKIAWILFSIMTVAVIVLSSILIANSIMWKSGKELLKVDRRDVQSIELKYSASTADGEFTYSTQLNEKQMNYVIYEFNSSMFKRHEELAVGGLLIVKITLKDDSNREFVMCGRATTIDGKQYDCCSYLSSGLMKILEDNYIE